jgi:hypothetical protein
VDQPIRSGIRSDLRGFGVGSTYQVERPQRLERDSAGLAGFLWAARPFRIVTWSSKTENVVSAPEDGRVISP